MKPWRAVTRMGPRVTLAPAGSSGRSRPQVLHSFFPLRSGAGSSIRDRWAGLGPGFAPCVPASAFPLCAHVARVLPWHSVGSGSWHRGSSLCPALVSAVLAGPGRAPRAVTSETVCPPPPTSSGPVRGMGVWWAQRGKRNFLKFPRNSRKLLFTQVNSCRLKST